ncbi:hypothetical protein EQ500_00850 [Lactobacillus sp. XV13L]|nr:hypothetical protein [Lactobacillus sp. XV13L]
MSLISLQFKRVLKSKFIWISMLAILLTCFYFWKNNYHIRNMNHYLIQAQENLVIQRKNVKYYRRQLKKANVDSAARKELGADFKEVQADVKESQKLIAAIQQNKWQNAYHILIKQEKADLADAKRNNLNDTTLAVIKRDLLQLKILAQNNLPEENEHYSVKGGYFVLEMMQEVLPPLAVLAVIFILTKLFSAGYFERMRLGNLLPQKRLVFTEFASGSLIGFGYFLLAFLLIFLLPSIFFGTGNFNYPMMGMNAGAKEYTFTPMYQLFLPTLFLELLSFVFIAATVLLLVQLFKNRLLALLVSALLLVGGMALPQYVVTARAFAQFLPMSYFFALQPVDGMFGISNAYVFADETQLVTYPQVNFTNGIIVLVLGTAVLLFLNQFMAQRAQKGRKTK